MKRNCFISTYGYIKHYIDILNFVSSKKTFKYFLKHKNMKLALTILKSLNIQKHCALKLSYFDSWCH